MHFALSFLLLTTVFIGCFAQNPNVTKVAVSVYYEALCPDSQKFFTSQLYPSLQNKNISEWIELQLVPYGKSTTKILDGDQYQFQCHHGTAECLGNKIQACALQEIEKLAPRSPNLGFNPTTVAFINCLMSKAGPNETRYNELLLNCSSINNVPQYVNIETCSNHPDGSKYLADLGNLTDTLEKPISYVPMIVFNNKLDKAVSKEAEANFIKTLCKHMTGSKPAECKNGSGALTVSYLALAVVLSKYFF